MAAGRRSGPVQQVRQVPASAGAPTGDYPFSHRCDFGQCQQSRAPRSAAAPQARRRSPPACGPRGASARSAGRRSPRQDTGIAGADHVDAVAPAACAAPPQADQRDIAAAGLDEAPQVCIGLVAAVPAGQQYADVAGGERRPRRRQDGIVRDRGRVTSFSSRGPGCPSPACSRSDERRSQIVSTPLPSVTANGSQPSVR
jgi:hypothetical protein